MVQLLPLDQVRQDTAAEGLDEGLLKESPVAGMKSIEGLAELACGWVNVMNNHVDSLCIRQVAGMGMIFKVFQEIFNHSKTS